MRLSYGVRQMLLSTLLFALMNVCVKQLHRLPALEIIFGRAVVSLAMSYVSVRRAGLPVMGAGSNRWLLVSRGITGALALMLYFASLQHLPLAVAVMLQYLSPIATSLVGIWAVREPVRPVQGLFFGLAFAGVLLTQADRTALPADASLWVGLGVLAAVLSGFSYNTIRRLRGREHPLVVVLWFPLVALPIGLAGTLYHGLWPTPIEWFWLLLTGIFTQGAQLSQTRAYQAEELSKVASLNYVGILYAVGFGYLLFHEKLSWSILAGMALVLAGVVANVWYKQRQENRVRQLAATAVLVPEPEG